MYVSFQSETAAQVRHVLQVGIGDGTDVDTDVSTDIGTAPAANTFDVLHVENDTVIFLFCHRGADFGSLGLII